MEPTLTSSRAFAAPAPCAFVADDSEEQRWLVRQMLWELRRALARTGHPAATTEWA